MVTAQESDSRRTETVSAKVTKRVQRAVRAVAALDDMSESELINRLLEPVVERYERARNEHGQDSSHVH